MTITLPKPRLFIYTAIALVFMAAFAIYLVSPALNSANLIFLIVATILSGIMLFKLFVSDGNLSNSRNVDDIDQKNMRLALNFQGQGKLDAAYALLKQCKYSEKIIHLLTNLAQDYEIINQRDNAQKVYSHILILQPENEFALNKIPGKVKKTHSLNVNKSDNNDIALFNSRFEIVKNIGKGTGSTIFLAKDHQNEKQAIALKILEINYDEKNALETELLARFMREAETAASLKHKNIISIIDSGHADNVAYIAMEYIRGKCLKEYSQPKALLPSSLIIDLIAQCADALDYAHNRGVIHRDVKPANILYNHAEGLAKLGDFGIAHIANSTQTLAGSFLGTPFYMSPEQLSALEVDARSDIFSLGATLYRLLTGIPPFSGASMARLMHSIVNEPHQNILEIRPNLRKNLVNVVEIALAKDPKQRFSSAAEFSDQLRQCAEKN